MRHKKRGRAKIDPGCASARRGFFFWGHRDRDGGMAPVALFHRGGGVGAARSRGMGEAPKARAG